MKILSRFPATVSIASVSHLSWRIGELPSPTRKPKNRLPEHKTPVTGVPSANIHLSGSQLGTKRAELRRCALFSRYSVEARHFHECFRSEGTPQRHPSPTKISPLLYPHENQQVILTLGAGMGFAPFLEREASCRFGKGI